MNSPPNPIEEYHVQIYNPKWRMYLPPYNGSLPVIHIVRRLHFRTHRAGLAEQNWIVALISHGVTSSMSNFGSSIIDSSQFCSFTIESIWCPAN